jgi:cellulose synthase (UDP-forming)
MTDKTYKIIKNDEMSPREKVEYTWLLTFGSVLMVIFGIWWFQPYHIPHNWSGGWHFFDFFLFIILSYIVWHEIIMEAFAWYMAAYMKRPSLPLPPEKNLRVAYCTAFVPGAEPYDLLEKTLKAIVDVDYPHDTWLLDEGDDFEAKKICQRYGVKHYSRKGKNDFNTDTGKFMKKTKGGNYNSWLYHYGHQYDIVAQHDVDFLPRKDFLMRTLGYFHDPKVAFVGTPQIYGNLDESWIARGAAEQTYGFYGPLQKGFYGHDMTLLIGANHIIRVEAYRDIDGYAAHIAEDMLTGMKLYAHRKNWKSIYVPEPLLIGEGPTTWAAYFGQQMRWSYGCMDIVFRHSAALLSKMNLRRIFNYSILQQFYFSGVAQVAGVILLTIYFLFGISPSNINFLPLIELYVPLILFQILFQLYLQRFNIDPDKEKGLLSYGKLLSLASWPVFFMAFMGVVRGKNITYVVTPKGEGGGGIKQPIKYDPSLFIPHFVLGTLTLSGIIIGVFANHMAGIMIFWASLNTMFMYYFFFAEAIPFSSSYIKNLLFGKNSSTVAS